MGLLTQIDTSTLSNQNISSALLVHTFTNTTRLRKVFIDVFLNQIAGNGDYLVYATRQRSGAGAEYEIGGRTTVSVPSGVTAQMFPTIALLCGATDVIKVYVVGLPGDTTTPDVITDISEEFINVDSSGNPTPNDSSGVTTMVADYARRTGDYSTLNAAGVRTAVGLASANLDTQLGDLPTAAEIDAELSSNHGASLWGPSSGNGGSLALTYTLNSTGGGVIQGATVELYAEVGMITLLDSKLTDSLGQVTFANLVAGTYYLKRIKAGFTFTNPDTEVVSA